MNEGMKKLSLILLCIPSPIMVTLLSSSMNYILEEYAQYGESLVTMILTIPTLTVIIGLFLAPILAKKFVVKNLLLIGLSIFIVCSILPAWCYNFYLILFLRAMSGVGCGIILPLQITCIATYPEKERATLIGLTTTVGCTISAVLIAFSGQIAEINWRYVFYLYGIVMIALVLAAIYLPKDMIASGKKHTAGDNISVTESKKLRSYGSILGSYYFLLIGSYLCITILTAEIAPYLASVGLGGAVESGRLMSVYVFGSMAAGLMLSKYVSVLKHMSITWIFIGSAIGCAGLWLASSILTVGIATFMLGLFAALISGVVTFELSRKLPLEFFTVAAAGTKFFVYVLQFFAPMLFLVVLDSLAGGSFRTAFLFYAIMQATFAVIAFLLNKFVIAK